jgi:glycosyltransferase involved in cell wall biosynthesis
LSGVDAAEVNNLSLRTISLLTPAHASVAQFLPELYRSIQSQLLPAGWVLEWVIWEDGDDPSLASVVAELVGKDPRVVYGASGRQSGPAVARTQAFHASRGEVVFGIDSDDVLEPGGLAKIIETFDTSHGIAWVTGATFEFDEHGNRTERSCLIAPGRLRAGQTIELWNTTGLSTPWYPTATAYQRWAVALLGGWPANVVAEDTELLACVTAAWDGMLIASPTMARRCWEGQMTKTPVLIEAAESARKARHARATLIDGWRRAGLLGTPRTAP